MAGITTPTGPDLGGMFGDLKKNWGWLLALGLLFLALGVIGVGMSLALTVAGVLYFGVLLIIGGGTQLVHGFKCKGWKSVSWHVLIALVYLAAGALAVYDPLGAAVGLTLVIAAALLASGTFRLAMSFQLRPSQGWWWPFVSALISIVLGGLILVQWPVSGLWVIGLFIAIELIVNGWSYIFVALAAKAAGPSASAGSAQANRA